MRNKKSVLMTSNHNYGCFSTVAGIAGNVLQIGGRFNAANVLLAAVFSY
jgi:hypothetical protein